MKDEVADYLTKFLVSLIMSPSFGVSLPDINSPVSITRRKEIATQLAEVGLITYVGKTKGRRWVMDVKLRDMVSQFVSVKPDVLVELANQAELRHPGKSVQIRGASDRVREMAGGNTQTEPLLAGAT